MYNLSIIQLKLAWGIVNNDCSALLLRPGALFQHRHHDLVIVAAYLFDKTYVIARKLAAVADRDVGLQNSEKFRKILNYYPLRGIFKENP